MTIQRSLPCLLLAAVAFTLPSTAVAFGQESVASLTGTITDATGAAVPGATVLLENPATSHKYKVVTNSTGSYTIANVAPGPGYRETVSHSGFKSEVLTGLYLNVSAVRSQNVVLSAGGVNETVEVSASNEDVTLDTTDATIGNNVQVQYLNELPVNFRDSPSALFTQQPGVTQDGSATGARTDQNRVTLDGLDVTDQAYGGFGTIVANAPVDSVQEFRGTVAGMTSNDEVGGGAQFSLVTKGGTNKFHGNINEYHRDTDLEANEWFNNFDGIPRSPLIRNQFGGNIGGPIWKDKLFFFFDYNGRRDTIAGQTERTVPTTSFVNRTAGMESSDVITYFTNIAANTTSIANAQQVAGFDPQGKGFDSPMFDLAAARYPVPNDFTGDRGDLLNTAGYRFNSPTPFKENNFVGRLDFALTQKHHFFGRVTYTRINSESANLYPNDPETYANLDDSHAWVAGWDWTIGSNKTNSLIWGETVAKPSSTVLYAPSGVNNYSLDGDPTGGTFLDALYPSAGGGKYLFPLPLVRDDFTWQKGSHTISIGGDFKYPTPHYSSFDDYNGATIGLGGGITGLTDADTFKFRPNDLDRNQTSLTVYDSALVFGLGRFASASATYNYDSSLKPVAQGTGSQQQYKYYETEVYASDTWKITPKLTLTYGLRYQNFTVPYEIHGIESVQDQSFWSFMNARISQSKQGIGGAGSLPGGPGAVPYITYALGGKANHGPSFYAPDNKDFAPRFAFAWTPSKQQKLVINGGAGLVYDETIINALLQEQSAYSYLFESSAGTDYGVSGNAVHSAQYYSLLNNPRFKSLAPADFPAGPSPSAITNHYAPFVGPGSTECNGASGPCGLAYGGAFNITVDRKLPTPYNIMYNFGMQQDLGRGFLLKMSYVGRLGRRLLGQADAEQLIDFPDSQSTQSYSQAIAALTTYLRQNPNSTNPPPQPWFEHVLNPNNTGVSNTAFVANQCAPYPARGDVADATQCMAYYGLLPANVGMGAQFSENTFFTDGGFSSYNGLLTTIHKNNSHGLQFDLNYTWSHSIDNVSQKANSYAYTGYGFLCDVLRPRLCRADSDFDVHSYVNGNFLYQLPFGRGRDFGATIPWWLDEIAGGWEVSGLPTFHTGTPYMANSVAFLMSYSNEDPAILTGNIGDMSSHVTIQNGQVYSFKNPSKAFSDYAAPTGFAFGARNNLRGPNFFLLDLGLGKSFTIVPEKVHLKFRADAYNALNHPNFQSPSFQNNMSLVSPPVEFGVIPGTQVPTGADQAARVLQGALRLEF